MRGFLFSFGGGALGALLVVVLHGLLTPQPTFASVDVQRLLTAHIAEIGHRELDADAQRRDAVAYASALEAALDEIAQQDHTIVLVGPAVLRGAPDLTEPVQASIERRLAGNGSGKKPPVPR